MGALLSCNVIISGSADGRKISVSYSRQFQGEAMICVPVNLSSEVLGQLFFDSSPKQVGYETPQSQFAGVSVCLWFLKWCWKRVRPGKVRLTGKIESLRSLEMEKLRLLVWLWILMGIEGFHRPQLMAWLKIQMWDLLWLILAILHVNTFWLRSHYFSFIILDVESVGKTTFTWSCQDSWASFPELFMCGEAAEGGGEELEPSCSIPTPASDETLWAVSFSLLEWTHCRCGP